MVFLYFFILIYILPIFAFIIVSCQKKISYKIFQTKLTAYGFYASNFFQQQFHLMNNNRLKFPSHFYIQ